jgi:hypothetical protein
MTNNLVALNDVVDLIRLLKEGGLRELLNEVGIVTTDCDIRCDCRTSKCGCKGVIAALDVTDMSPPELRALRIERVEELWRQLEEAERQLAEAEAT